MKLKISRKRWWRGNTENPGTKHEVYSALRLTDGVGRGKQCCLGFLARECGLKVKDISNVAYPRGVGAAPTRHHEVWGKVVESSGDIADANDNPMPARERERTIKRLFKAIGVDVEFVA